LKNLEKYNFNVFEPKIHKIGLRFPFTMFNAAKHGRFYITGKID
jgi:hypothetical protein